MIRIGVAELRDEEVSGALARRTNNSRLGRAALETLKGYEYLHLYAVDHVLASLAAELAADCQLRGADAVYVALAYTRNVPLVTWDQEQIARVQLVRRRGQTLSLVRLCGSLQDSRVSPTPKGGGMKDELWRQSTLHPSPLIPHPSSLTPHPYGPGEGER